MSANNSNKEKPFFTNDTIPTPEQNPEFWEMIDSPHFKNNINFLILFELRRANPLHMDDVQCRVILSKLKAYTDLMESPEAFKDAINPPLNIHGDDPLDPEPDNQ